jgi:hypothetical protein
MLGMNFGTKLPINGGPFHEYFRDTNKNGRIDDEDYTYWTQQPWNKGSADKQDWSKDGQQYDRPH